MTDQTRARRLDKARQQLGALPDLLAELACCLTERPPVDNTGTSHGPTGSRPPLRLDVLHLVDTRQKPGWTEQDPRSLDLTARYGVLPALGSWTRVLVAERAESGVRVNLAPAPTISSECSTLLDHWAWITEQQWASELADDVHALTGQIRAALGRVDLRLRCPDCGDRAFVTGLWLVCDSGHETSVRNLAQQQRRRAAITTQQAAEEFHVNEAMIWQWHNRGKPNVGKLQPVNPGGKPLQWMPWDVLRMVNPDLVAAAEAQDDVPA